MFKILKKCNFLCRFSILSFAVRKQPLEEFKTREGPLINRRSSASVVERHLEKYFSSFALLGDSNLKKVLSNIISFRKLNLNKISLLGALREKRSPKVFLLLKTSRLTRRVNWFD